MSERISTGCDGLDKILDGGILPNRAYVIKGGMGTGKTTLAFQFIKAALERGESPLYVSYDGNLEALKTDIGFVNFKDPRFGLNEANPAPLFQKKLQSYHQVWNQSLDVMDGTTDENTLVVIDSLPAMLTLFADGVEQRRGIMQLFYRLRNSTLIVITDGDAFSSQLAHGVFKLSPFSIGIPKMPGMSAIYNAGPYRITDEGIELVDTRTKEEE